MKLRQKLFAAILAVMVVVFLLLALVSFMHALEANRAQHDLQKRLDAMSAHAFKAAARCGEEYFTRLADEANALDPSHIWVAGPAGGKFDGKLFVEVARHGGYALFRSRRPAYFQSVRWLSGIFWATAAGTALLMLTVYGLLLRLVLRPVDNLVAASRGLSKGVRPPKVGGESRTDEMGELIRAFNSMAEEVVTGRNAPVGCRESESRDGW